MASYIFKNPNMFQPSAAVMAGRVPVTSFSVPLGAQESIGVPVTYLGTYPVTADLENPVRAALFGKKVI
jgi:hypothetical protein